MSTTISENPDFAQSAASDPTGRDGEGHGRHRGGCGCGGRGGMHRRGRWSRRAGDGQGPEARTMGEDRVGFGPDGRFAGDVAATDHWPFPVKALTVLAGFAVFPPLGLGALAWFVWRARQRRWDWGGHEPAFAGFGSGHRRGRGHHHRRWRGDDAGSGGGTGNAAFEARRREVLDQIEAERRKLEEEAQAFADFRARERRARDQQTYDRFRAETGKDADGSPAA